MNYWLIVAIVVGVFVAFNLVWRWASTQWQIPCPTALAWLLENPLADAVAGTRRTIERMPIRAGQTVVEIGPGPGRLLVPVAQLVGEQGQAIGIELQPGMVKRSQAKLERAGLRQATLIQGDATGQHLPDASVDLVFLCTVLGEIPDRAAALARCLAMLRPGGVLSISELALDPHFQSQTAVRRQAEAAGFEWIETLGRRFSFTMNFRRPA